VPVVVTVAVVAKAVGGSALSLPHSILQGDARVPGEFIVIVAAIDSALA